MLAQQKRAKVRKKQKKPSQAGDVITVDEAAQRLRVARLTVYRAVRNGGLPSIRVGRRYLIPRVAFERLLLAQQDAA